MKYVYDYEFTVAPNAGDFNSRGTRPTAYTGYVNGVRSQDLALAHFMAENFPVLRKNGIVRGKNQLLERLSVKRVRKYIMKKLTRKAGK